MNRSLLALAFASASLLAVACGKKSDPTAAAASTASGAVPTRAAAPTASANPDGASCHSKDGMCVEWTDLALTDLKDAMESCNDPGDQFDLHGCPTANLLGTCDHPKDKTKIFLYKSDVVSSVAEAKAFCDDGVFAAAAGASKPAKQARK